MSIATDLNLSCLQDLVDYLQRQDMRPTNYTLSPHFHNAVTEFCDRNHLPQPETMELHPPTHVSGLLHHSSLVSLLSHLPSYRQKEYLPFPGWQRPQNSANAKSATLTCPPWETLHGSLQLRQSFLLLRDPVLPVVHVIRRLYLQHLP